MANGVQRIKAERARQMNKEGWTAEHDDEHKDSSLAKAAACYASPYFRTYYQFEMRAYKDGYADMWPWDKSWDKRVEEPTIDERIRELEKAGALVAAEIDRLLRQKLREELAELENSDGEGLEEELD